MAVTALEIRSRAPFAGGHSFGETGAYERIDGLLHYAVDPSNPANASIVDLDRAPRGPDGLVHFSGDLCLLQPREPARASGKLLLEVPNRGRRGALGAFNPPAPSDAPALDTGGIAIGDGLLLSQGWTVAWVGWQWDVIRDSVPEGLVGFDAPPAIDEPGQPIHGQVMVEWQPDAWQRDKLLADRVHQPYVAARLDEPGATLTTRAWPGASRVTVERSRWRFARDEGGRPVVDPTHVWLEGGFHPGVLYDLLYTTATCPVVGAGLLAIRDGASFLRYGSAAYGNPAAGRLRHAYGYGSSQCGRFLREFLLQGQNVDEAGRQAYDGLLVHVAGARRGEFNHRYAQPSVITIPSFGMLPPYGYDRLLHRQRERGGVPKVIATNTSAEYWNREASLLHTDPEGTHDVEPPENVRVYHFAGTKHGAGSIAPAAGETVEPPLASGRQRVNVVDFRPLLRAALFNLDAWVTESTPPPPSRHPRLTDGTAARPADVLRAFQAMLPDLYVPDPERLFIRRALDLGPEAPQGVDRFPAEEGAPLTWYVSALDEAGNERGSIRLPDVAVPVATHTGWFPRRREEGGAGQNVDMKGASFPFPPDEAARQASRDPRLSIATRYRDRDDYLAQVRACAEALAQDGYLLSRDVPLVAQNALARYDAFATAQPLPLGEAAEGG